MKQKFSSYLILIILLSYINSFPQSVWFLNPTNGESVGTTINLSWNYSNTPYPYALKTFVSLHTENNSYNADGEGEIPQWSTLPSGSYTWTLKLHERFGEKQFITAETSITFYVKNKIYLSNNFNFGKMNVDGRESDVPTDVMELSGSSINLGAIDQIDQEGYQRIWNTNGTYNSEWKKETTSLSYSRNY